MELKIEGNRFYVLEVGREKWVHDTVESAVQALKERVRAENDLNPDNIRVVDVNILKRKWEIQEVPMGEHSSEPDPRKNGRRG